MEGEDWDSCPDDALGGGNQGPSAPGWARQHHSTQLEKNHVVSPSSQDEALACHSVSREVPRFILKFETVLGATEEEAGLP